MNKNYLLLLLFIFNILFVSSLDGLLFAPTYILCFLILSNTIILSNGLKIKIFNQTLFFYFILFIALLNTIYIHPDLTIKFSKNIILYVLFSILVSNMSLRFISKNFFSKVIYFSIWLVFLNSIIGFLFNLGEVHENTGFLGTRSYAFLGDSINFFYFVLFESLRFINLKNKFLLYTLILLTVLISGSKIIIILILVSVILQRGLSNYFLYLIILISMLFFADFLYSLIQDEINYSLNTRLLGLLYAIELFSNNFFSGIGFNESNIFIESLSDKQIYTDDYRIYDIDQIDNSLLRLAAEMGVFGISIYISIILLLFKISNNNKFFLLVIILLQTSAWHEPINASLYSLSLLALIYEKYSSFRSW